MRDALAAEWLKLRSVPSTLYVLVAAAGFVPVSALVSWQIASAWDAGRTDLPTIRPEAGLLMFVQLCLAALGVLAATAEYRSGMVRTTFQAMPRRVRVLLAKAVVVGAVALVAGLLSVFAMFLLGRLVIGDRPIPGLASPVAGELPRLLGLGGSVMVVAVVGLGLGFLTRSSTGALTIVAALLFVVPAAGQLLPEPWDARFYALTLPQLPQQLAGGPDAYLSPPAALAVMAAYVVAALVGAAAVTNGRDA